MLIDTDLLIWYLRGNQRAYDFIESHKPFHISVITYIEIVQGMRNKRELSIFKKKAREWDARLVYINQEISIRAMFYIERHFLSHSLELADALIAATGIVYGLTLVTCNQKHYKIIKELKLEPFECEP